MLAEFGLDVIKRFGPEYFAQVELINSTSARGTRRN